jgi:hypothetical protein
MTANEIKRLKVLMSKVEATDPPHDIYLTSADTRIILKAVQEEIMNGTASDEMKAIASKLI